MRIDQKVVDLRGEPRFSCEMPVSRADGYGWEQIMSKACHSRMRFSRLMPHIVRCCPLVSLSEAIPHHCKDSSVLFLRGPSPVVDHSKLRLPSYQDYVDA